MPSVAGAPSEGGQQSFYAIEENGVISSFVSYVPTLGSIMSKLAFKPPEVASEPIQLTQDPQVNPPSFIGVVTGACRVAQKLWLEDPLEHNA